MIYAGKHLQLFVIECPYDSYVDAELRSLLPSVFELKIRGYRKEHPYGILPVDAYDQVGNHIILAERMKGSWVPRMGFKSVTLDRCNTHKLEFPLFGYLKGSSSLEHRGALNAILDEFKGREHELGYNGSWTMDPQIRADREYRDLVKDITRAAMFHYYTSYSIPVVTAFAVMRFKVHEEKLFMGWDYMKFNGRPVAPFRSDAFFGETFALMELRKHSDAMFSIAEKHAALWDSRITLGMSFLRQELIRKAA